MLLGYSCIHECHAGLEADVAKFFLFYLMLVLSAVGAAAIAFTFSASCASVFSVANLLASLIFVFCMVCGHVHASSNMMHELF